jgi:hypothetical protein
MGLLKEIEFKNPQVQDLDYRIRRFEEQITTWNQRSERMSRDLAEYIEDQKAIVDYNEKVTHAGIAVPDFLENKIRVILHDLNMSEQSNQASINRLERDISSHNRELSPLKEQRARLTDNEMVRISKDGVKASLESIGAVNPRTVCVGEDTHGQFVRWRYDNIWMSPDKNTYPSINNGGPVRIKLEPLTCTFYVRNNSVAIVPIRGGRRIENFSGRPTGHPHILDNNRPCLGDYTTPVAEAISEQDWPTLASLMEMFLSNATVDDAAGRYWFRWLQLVPGIEWNVGTYAARNPQTQNVEQLIRIGPKFARIQIDDNHANVTLYDTYEEYFKPETEENEEAAA